MLNILANSLLIALRMGAPRHSRDGRSPEPVQRRKPADQRA